MTTTTELVIGQQATAAETVTAATATYQQVLQALADNLQAQSAGFAGQAAAGFAEAVGAWFEVAVRLSPALEGYAAALAQVDLEHGENETKVVSTFSHLAGRLGGAK